MRTRSINIVRHPLATRRIVQVQASHAKQTDRGHVLHPKCGQRHYKPHMRRPPFNSAWKEDSAAFFNSL